jgi:hypothetical protein
MINPTIKIPDEIFQDYTFNGKISFVNQYIDASFFLSHKVFSKSQIDIYTKELKENGNQYLH